MNTSLSLDSLASAINAAHERCQASYRTVLDDAHCAGELLLQAKAQVPYGQWGNWIEQNCAFSDRTARHYMQIATHWEEIQSTSATVADLGVRGAIESIADKNAPEVVNKKVTPINSDYPITTRPPKPDIRPGDRVTVADPESPEYGQELEVSEIVQNAIALCKKGNESYPFLVNQVEVAEREATQLGVKDKGDLAERLTAGKQERFSQTNAGTKNTVLAARREAQEAREHLEPPIATPRRNTKGTTVVALQDLLRRILDECEEYLSPELIEEARELL